MLTLFIRIPAGGTERSCFIVIQCEFQQETLLHRLALQSELARLIQTVFAGFGREHQLVEEGS